jgi:hypothetical protein
MIGNYHTQVIVTVPYISTLQLPGVVHVGRFSSLFTKPLKQTHARWLDIRANVAHAWVSSNQDAGKFRTGPASSRHVRDGSKISKNYLFSKQIQMKIYIIHISHVFACRRLKFKDYIYLRRWIDWNRWKGSEIYTVN